MVDTFYAKLKKKRLRSVSRGSLQIQKDYSKRVRKCVEREDRELKNLAVGLAFLAIVTSC